MTSLTKCEICPVELGMISPTVFFRGPDSALSGFGADSSAGPIEMPSSLRGTTVGYWLLGSVEATFGQCMRASTSCSLS